MADFYNERRPECKPTDDDYRTPVDTKSVADANQRVRFATPDHKLTDVNRRIRTTAVRRHRGREQFGSVGEYIEFLTGTNDGSE